MKFCNASTPAAIASGGASARMLAAAAERADAMLRHIRTRANGTTRHFCVTAAEMEAAHAAGLSTVGITTQAEALMGLGIQDRLQAVQADPATTFEAYTLLRSSLMRLMDPAAMGRFRVMAFGRDWPGDPDERPLGLFSFRLAGARRA